ncbi:MAG: response regulator transcription factor [Rikenellaceae bacterium]
MKILIIEDNAELSRSICDYLTSLDYDCEVAYNCAQALMKIGEGVYNCILLDIGLPDGSGLDVLESLSKHGKRDGVIIISAKDSLDDKIRGIEMGADDYLVKPFHLEELAVRVFSVIRRGSFGGNKNEIFFGSLRVDLMSKEAFYGGVKFQKLSNKEYKLLLLFLSSPRWVLSKDAIAEHLLGDNIDTFDNFDCVYAHVKNLRKRLREAGCEEYLKSVYGMGYKFSD